MLAKVGDLVKWYELYGDDTIVKDAGSGIVIPEDINKFLNLSELSIINEAYSLAKLPLIGEHNFKNYIAAILAANTCGIEIRDAIESLESFNGVKRRLEFKGEYSGIKIYDDFAHHPTAISFTAKAIRDEFKDKKIFGIIELGSNKNIFLL